MSWPALHRLVAGLALLGFGSCGDLATLLPESAGFGPEPALPAPQPTLIPTVHIAPAKGWPSGATPVAAAGLTVNAFARDLDHPRWLHVLPNGDVLVAETNAPPRPEDGRGFKGWAMKSVMARAGAAVPSANRITLLRDTDGDGVADLRGVFPADLNSPFGMALVGDDFYVANTDAVLRFPYRTGVLRIDGPGTRVAALPAGPRNHHWTKNLLATPPGPANRPACTSRSAPTATSRNTGSPRKWTGPPSSSWIPRRATTGSSPAASATRTDSPGSPQPVRCGP